MRRQQTLLVTLGSAALVACGSGQTSHAQPASGEARAARDTSTVGRDLARLRAATAAFRRLDAAVAAGYARDVAQCVAHPQHGGMGFHHTNPGLLDARLEVERPEILVYGRAADGTYKLNGVEYVVPYTAHSRDAAPPSIMGQSLIRADGLGLWYLHVWAWDENPKGLFASWHPGVKCP
jgi:hypothetical protein